MLKVKALSKSYIQGRKKISVLKNLDFQAEKGESIGLVGSSGSGKSTFLHQIGLLDTPDTGQIFFFNKLMPGHEDKIRTAFRARHIGFVYQFHHLLLDFTALENVIIPQLILGNPPYQAVQRSHRLLKDLGLGHRCSHYPSQLSGGEQQRLAIGRAMANNPDLILADEPTGNLDAKTAQVVFEQLISFVKDQGKTIIIATHDQNFMRHFDRIVYLQDATLKTTV